MTGDAILVDDDSPGRDDGHRALEGRMGAVDGDIDPPTGASAREERLFDVLSAYLQAVESGDAPSRRAFLECHPDLAHELSAFLDEEDRLHRMVKPLRDGIRTALPGGHGLSAHVGADGGRFPEQTLDPSARTVGRDFGDYELLEVIGSGGMGVVFRARQKGLDREVAVKMIRGGDLAAADDLRRFRLEAGASAHLDHPHIVPIYEVGEHQGYCYYVMKLIEGGSLEKRLHEFADHPRAAARLVASVARAVHHAHQRGVLHRDLKPSNILIDDEWRGHVADFGLAKRMGAQADATQTGLIIGTPSYMAPEQASGKKDAVTTATDVYGLGALLYSVLTGRPPFRGDSILDTIEQVRVREPEPPTTESGLLDRDLQTICLTCLRKEPGRRYASAAALADDLERWDAGEPISARPMRPGERAWRWARREPLSAGLGAALAVLSVLAVVGLVASNVMIGRERDLAQAQRRIAQDESRHAEVERQRALDRSRQARQAVDEMYTEVAEKWLYEQPKLSQIQRDFLKKALAFYEQFSREEGGDPAIRLERAKALSRLAWIQLRLGHPREAEASLYRPVEILEGLVAQYPNHAEYLEALGHACGTLGSHLSEQKRWKEANEVRERAMAAYEKLVRVLPAEASYRTTLALQQAQLGLQYQFTGRALEAQKLGFDGLASLDRLKSDFPARSDPHDLSTRMRVLEDVGCILVENRRYAEAEQVLRESIALAERLPANVIAHQDLLHRIAHTNMYLGNMLGKVVRWSEAETAYNRALGLFNQLTADYPDLPLYQVDVIDAQLGLVDVLRETGRRSEALASVGSGVERSEQLARVQPELVNCRRTLLAALTRKGRLLAEHGSPHDVEAVYRQAFKIAEELATVDTHGVYPRHRLGSALIALGDFLTYSGRGTEAAELLNRGVEIFDKLASDCPAVPDYKQSLGQALCSLAEERLAANCLEKAECVLERAANLFREIAPLADTDPELADNIARFFTSCPIPRFRDHSLALELASRAARRFPQSGRLRSTLGLARFRTGDWKGAIQDLNAARSLRNTDGDAVDWFLLAMAHYQAGEKADARACYEHAAVSIPAVTRGRQWNRLQREASTLLGIR